MVTNVDIDGLNLYDRALQGTGFKWLNLRLLAQILFPLDTIHRIWYFTALVRRLPGDPSKPQRQRTYLRALDTLPGFEAVYGNIRPRTKTRPLLRPIAGLPNYVEIRDFEEKGSDVNLATRLLIDGFGQDCEQAVVITNDADLSAPMKYIRDDLKQRIVVVNPAYDSPANPALVEAVNWVRNLRVSHLRHSQFPPMLQDAQGIITKPAGWD